MLNGGYLQACRMQALRWNMGQKYQATEKGEQYG